MSRAQRCHRGRRGCLVSRAAIGSPSGCPGDPRHCLRHANSGTSRRGSTARVVPSRSVSPCRACVSLFSPVTPPPPSPRGGPLGLFLFPAFATRSSFVLYLLPSPLLAQNRRPYLSRALPSRLGFPSRALYPTALARTPAFSSHRRASRLSFSLALFRERVAHPIPTTPMLQDAGVPPPPRRPATRRPPRA